MRYVIIRVKVILVSSLRKGRTLCYNVFPNRVGHPTESDTKTPKRDNFVRKTTTTLKTTLAIYSN
jgi:hypothetical protein